MKLDKQVKDYIRTELWSILDNLDCVNVNSGICALVIPPPGMVFHIDSRYNVRQWLKAQFSKWPLYSGDPSYPVPAPADYSHKYHTKIASTCPALADRWVLLPDYYDYSRLHESAFDNLNLWKGEYGASRIQLVMFLLQQLDK